MKLSKIILPVVLVCMLLLFCGCGKEYVFEDGIFAGELDEQYASVLSSWRLAAEERFGADLKTGEHKEYPNLPKEFEPMEWGMVDICYSYYDIDRNGSPELLVAGRGENKSGYYIFDIYALNDSTPVRIFENTAKTGFERYNDNIVFLSADGNKLIWKKGGKNKCFVLSENGYSVEKYEEACAAYTGKDLQKLYDKLKWKDLCAPVFREMSASDFIDISDKSYKGVPEAYQSVLNCLRRWLDLRFECMDQFTEKAFYELFDGRETVNFGLEAYSGKSSIDDGISQTDITDYGYGLYDLNGDKSKELLIMTRDKNDNKQVWDIFSINDGKPKCLVGFTERSRCYGIDEDGIIHSGYSDSSFNVFRRFKIVDSGHIGEEYISASPRTIYSNGKEELVGYKYKYRNTISYDPDTVNDAQEINLTSKEGKEIFLSLRCDPAEDDAPFVKFIPLFE